MNFISLEFFYLLAGALVLYYVVPPRFSTLRSLVLMAVCGYFYYYTQRQYVLLLPCSILISYLSAMLMDRIESRSGRLAVFWLSAALIAGALIVFKYTGFITDTVFRLTGRRFAEGINLIAPLGISFYTFRILSYLADVSRRKYAHCANPVKYAVYVSFFPAILAGPIDRADSFLPQLDKPAPFRFDQLESSGLLFLWGVFIKMIADDRLSLFAGAIYRSYTTQPGSYLLLATFAYSLQIYCDFSAYSNMARGVGGMFGFRMMKNFEQPYLALSVGEFWRRWHISLSSWLRDYIYIPLGGNRRGRFRKYVNLMVTFLVSGLWHGSSWNYLVWGGLNGMFQILEDLTKPVRLEAPEGKKGLPVRVLKRVVVFLEISLTWVFFFGNGTKNALMILLRMITRFNAKALISPAIFQLGLGKADFAAILFALLVQWRVDALAYRGKDVIDSVRKLYLPYRWFLYYVLIFSILIFGMYGMGYSASQFVYLQF